MSRVIPLSTGSVTMQDVAQYVDGAASSPDAVAPSGLVGATNPSRYVGATSSGAPASGTFIVGDYIIDQSGQIWLCVAAGSPGTWTCATRSLLSLLANGVGSLISEPIPAVLATSATAPNTQNVWGVLTPIRGGSVVTGIVIRNSTAAAGTNPTTVRFGLADKTGKMLAVSGNYGTGGTNNATTIFAAGVNRIPFTSTYTTTADDVFFAVFIVNGTWGTTQPTPILAGNASGASLVADGSFPPPNFTWASQTDLPAVNSSLTITNGSTRSYYMALY